MPNNNGPAQGPLLLIPAAIDVWARGVSSLGMIGIGKSRPWLGTIVVSGWILSACGSGNSTGANPDFRVSADTAAGTTLGTAVTVHVHLTSTGLAGVVSLSVTGAPGTWTVTPPSNPVNLTANGQTIADVVVTIPSNGDAAPSGRTLTIEATVASHSDTAQTVVTVANQFIAPIAVGANSAGGHWGALAGTTIHLNTGTLLTFRNDDTTSHLIHAGTSLPGLQHQNTSGPGIAPGGTYDQTLTGTGTDLVYCHLHATPADNIRITVP